MQRLGEVQVENEQLQRENKTLKIVTHEQGNINEQRLSQQEFRHKAEMLDLKDNRLRVHTMEYEDLRSQLVRAVYKFE